jgi:RasGEF domain
MSGPRTRQQQLEQLRTQISATTSKPNVVLYQLSGFIRESTSAKQTQIAQVFWDTLNNLARHCATQHGQAVSQRSLTQTETQKLSLQNLHQLLQAINLLITSSEKFLSYQRLSEQSLIHFNQQASYQAVARAAGALCVIGDEQYLPLVETLHTLATQLQPKEVTATTNSCIDVRALHKDTRPLQQHYEHLDTKAQTNELLLLFTQTQQSLYRGQPDFHALETLLGVLYQGNKKSPLLKTYRLQIKSLYTQLQEFRLSALVRYDVSAHRNLRHDVDLSVFSLLQHCQDAQLAAAQQDPHALSQVLSVLCEDYFELGKTYAFNIFTSNTAYVQFYDVLDQYDNILHTATDPRNAELSTAKQAVIEAYQQAERYDDTQLNHLIATLENTHSLADTKLALTQIRHRLHHDHIIYQLSNYQQKTTLKQAEQQKTSQLLLELNNTLNQVATNLPAGGALAAQNKRPTPNNDGLVRYYDSLVRHIELDILASDNPGVRALKVINWFSVAKAAKLQDCNMLAQQIVAALKTPAIHRLHSTKACLGDSVRNEIEALRDELNHYLQYGKAADTNEITVTTPKREDPYYQPLLEDLESSRMPHLVAVKKLIMTSDELKHKRARGIIHLFMQAIETNNIHTTEGDDSYVNTILNTFDGVDLKSNALINAIQARSLQLEPRAQATPTNKLVKATRINQPAATSTHEALIEQLVQLTKYKHTKISFVRMKHKQHWQIGFYKKTQAANNLMTISKLLSVVHHHLETQPGDKRIGAILEHAWVAKKIEKYQRKYTAINTQLNAIYDLLAQQKIITSTRNQAPIAASSQQVDKPSKKTKNKIKQQRVDFFICDDEDPTTLSEPTTTPAQLTNTLSAPSSAESKPRPRHYPGLFQPSFSHAASSTETPSTLEAYPPAFAFTALTTKYQQHGIKVDTVSGPKQTKCSYSRKHQTAPISQSAALSRMETAIAIDSIIAFINERLIQNPDGDPRQKPIVIGGKNHQMIHIAQTVCEELGVPVTLRTTISPQNVVESTIRQQLRQKETGHDLEAYQQLKLKLSHLAIPSSSTADNNMSKNPPS